MFKRIQYNSPVILTYSLVSLVALFLNKISEGVANDYFFSVYKSSMLDPLFYFRLFGHVLGHTDFPHYFNNFILILLIGPMLEEKYGLKTILVMMLATALITGLLNALFFKAQLLGASGIVFMLILLSSFVNLQKGMIPITLVVVIAVFIGREVMDGLFKIDNISHLTHVVGGICGAVLGFYINRRKLQ